MPWYRAAFLILVLAASSGYRFRCFAFCTDQTGIQDDYIEQRDHCREYAQTKIDAQTHATDSDKSHKSQLVTLFSECMAKNGWTVPDGREGMPAGTVVSAPVSPTTPFGQATVGPAPVAAVAIAPLPAAAASANHTVYLHRASECAFARQNASVSSNAAARAKACDFECADRMRAAPDLPRPAACPAVVSARSPHDSEDGD